MFSNLHLKKHMFCSVPTPHLTYKEGAENFFGANAKTEGVQNILSQEVDFSPNHPDGNVKVLSEFFWVSSPLANRFGEVWRWHKILIYCPA